MRKLLLLMCFISFYVTVQSQSVKIESDGFRWIPYMEYGRYGAKSVGGETIIPAKYFTCCYERGHFFVKNNTGENGIFSKDGKILVPIENSLKIFELAEMKNNSPFIVVGDNGYRAYSPNGVEIIPQNYRYITPYITSKGIYYVVIAYNGLSGLVDEYGKFVIRPDKYNALIVSDIAGDVRVSYFIYGSNRSTGVCDIMGNVLIDTKYTYVIPKIDSCKNLYYEIAIGNSLGKLSLSGDVIEAPIAKKSYIKSKLGSKSFYIVIDENSRYGIANTKKRMIIPCEYDLIEVSAPYLRVKKGRYMGLFNEKFKSVIPTESEYVTASYLDGKFPFIVAITENNKQALFDVTGKQLSKPLYSNIQSHVFTNTNDTILVYKENGLFGVKTIEGKSIFTPKYYDLNYMETPVGNFYQVFKNGLVGLCNSDGIEIIPPQFTGIVFKRQKDKDYFYAQNDKYAAIFNIDGSQLINGETFSKITFDEDESLFIAIQGDRRCYFTKEGMLIKDNSLKVEQDKYISIADSYFEDGDYKLAVKNYGLAIDINPASSLYFNRGVSYYNMDKYKDAISDFRHCLESNPSGNLRSQCYDLIDKAEEFLSQKTKKRKNIVKAIFGLVLTGANIYFETQSQKHYSKNNNSSTNQNEYSSSDSNRNRSNDKRRKSEVNSSKDSKDCISWKVHHGKYYCANTGDCGMCTGTGLVHDGYGLTTKHQCTLCGGTGKCKYCH